MTIREFARVDKNGNDLVTGKLVDHREYYSRIVNRVGITRIANLLPCTIEEVERALKSGDEYLNSIPIKLWDSRIPYVRNIMYAAGITGLSIAECVCVLKTTAVMVATDSNN